MEAKEFEQVKQRLHRRFREANDYGLAHPEVIVLAVLASGTSREEVSYAESQIQELRDIGEAYRLKHMEDMERQCNE